MGPRTNLYAGTSARKIGSPVPDRLMSRTLDEVKNVQRLSYTRQIKDFHLFSQATNRQFTIFVRPTTPFSGPLRKLIEEGTIFTQNIP
jgi:hypothetical protein